MINIVFIFVYFLGVTYGDENWSYDYETTWPGICVSGSQQSPINIMSGDAITDSFGAHIRGPLDLRGYKGIKVHAKNTGHTLQWERVGSTPAPVVSGGPLRGNYSFFQFHLHWLSEHAIDGMKYAMEIHMVHVKTGYTIDEALKMEDGLAVIGIMGQVVNDGRSTHALDYIMQDLPNLLHPTDGFIDSPLDDLSRLLSPDPQSFYTYHGSLTTPNCEEAVTWIVMDKPIYVSQEQYKLLMNVNLGRLDNYRSLQPNNRVVYRSVSSCANMLIPSFLVFLTSSLHCLATNLYSALKKGLCKLDNVKKSVTGGAIKNCKRLN